MTAYELKRWGILHSAQMLLQHYLRHFFKKTKGFGEEGTASLYSNVKTFHAVDCMEMFSWISTGGSPLTQREVEREREDIDGEDLRNLKKKKNSHQVFFGRLSSKNICARVIYEG
jgi:hypothetical protein